MKKRIWAVLIALCLVVGLVPAVSAEEVASGTCGENLTWVLTDDGTLTISGEGEMDDFKTLLDDGTEGPGAPWPMEIEHIVIEEGVTSIGNYAFVGCGTDRRDNDGNRYDLVVELPQSLTRIGDWAFLRSRGLRKISVPDSVTELGEGAFCYSYLGQFEFPKGVSKVSKKLFFECRDLSEVILHDGITEIGEDAFGYCTFETIDIPNSVTTIHEGAFTHNYRMTRITFPKSVSYIAYYALGYMDNMEEITILNPQCTIEEGMYYANSFVSDATGERYGSIATFYGYPGSTAQTYAEAEGFDFIPLSPFTDVPTDSFYHAPVLWAVENGITSGATETTFNPDGDCLRAQVVTFLWRAAGEPAPVSENNPFVDVKETDFYYDAVLWAVENGITNGTDATHFNPMGVCNRAQVVTFLHRAFEEPAVEGAENPFADVADDVWYAEPVLWAVENGVTNGLSATEFGPNANCNRAQIVTFLHRAYTE